jgi:hypothetical protein
MKITGDLIIWDFLAMAFFIIFGRIFDISWMLKIGGFLLYGTLAVLLLFVIFGDLIDSVINRLKNLRKNSNPPSSVS